MSGNSPEPNIFERIRDEIAGDDGFWNSSSEETFVEAAKKLQLIGMGDEEILEMLSDLYSAVAAEFGS